ncbi:hypothetical protein [Arthrobacter sp. H-02-3]|uniref:hypothetical protein n=1 Tax=Arthrobacter sp. H-02-3 TaxID=2703675 RepID=UPI000DD1ABE0|nr:hypothetical protein [Arthrobacter sp. H-02-3]PVZ55201.1 hypothetical protein C9424_14160 [Arthrobacter sp. H-02-3]
MSDNKPGTFRIGDAFPVDLVNEADCPAVDSRQAFRAFCVLDKGHGGQHVAVGAEGKVVQVWR